MEYSGFAASWDRVVFRGDPATREFIAFWLAGGRVLAGMNVNVWDVNEPIQALIASGSQVDVARLGGPGRGARGPARQRPRAGVVNRLRRLHDAGVSIWLDTLSRDLLETGEFATLVDESAVTGATSNPTIFAKAITGSDRYDDQLRALHASGTDDGRELFFAVALDDVRAAAALLRPAHEASGGGDGFISFECTPDVADDAEATIAQALDLWHRLDLPNVLIKVPATSAGVVAIEELTARGVNVNVTLLFSVERYEQVIEAYLRGLERRSPRASRSTGSPRWPRSSSRASMPRPTRCSRPARRCAAASRSPTRIAPTRATWRASRARAGRRCSAPARRRSARCGRAPGRRTRATPTSSTSSG